MTELQHLPQISSKLAQDLRSVGVSDIDILRCIGAEEAAARLADAGRPDSDRCRRSLEQALAAGTRWPTRTRR